MSNLLRKYIREILTEVSYNKKSQGIKPPNPYEINNYKQGSFEQNNFPGRIGKKWFQENSDQQWLNGPVENIVALHNPVAFNIKEYRNYESCKRDMLIQYPCNTIVKNEQSALGFINTNADVISTDDFISQKLKKFDTGLFQGLNNTLFLHLSPRRITHASAVDSMTNTYTHFPKLTSVSLKDWNRMSALEMLNRYENHIDIDDLKMLKAFKYYDPDSQKRLLNDMKNKYKHLRMYINDPSYNYFMSRQSSGARKWPQQYTFNLGKRDRSRSKYDKQDILDLEDWDYVKNNYYQSSEVEEEEESYENVFEDVMGEIIVGNFKINAVWVNVNLINQTDFNKWMNGEYSDEFINFKYSFPNDAGLLKIQDFYRLKYFIECGVKVNYYSDLEHQHITDEYLLDNLRDKLKIVDEKGLITLDYKGDVMKQSMESFNKYLKSEYKT